MVLKTSAVNYAAAAGYINSKWWKFKSRVLLNQTVITKNQGE